MWCQVVLVWDSGTGTVRRRLEGHLGQVTGGRGSRRNRRGGIRIKRNRRGGIRSRN